MTGENAGAITTNDNLWIIGTVRNYGIYALDIRDNQNPILTDRI